VCVYVYVCVGGGGARRVCVYAVLRKIHTHESWDIHTIKEGQKKACHAIGRLYTCVASVLQCSVCCSVVCVAVCIAVCVLQCSVYCSVYCSVCVVCGSQEILHFTLRQALHCNTLATQCAHNTPTIWRLDTSRPHGSLCRALLQHRSLLNASTNK